MTSSGPKFPNVFEFYAEMLRGGGAASTAMKAQQKMSEKGLQAMQQVCEAMAVYTNSQQNAFVQAQSQWMSAFQKSASGAPQNAFEAMNAATLEMMTQSLSEQSAAAQKLAQSLSKAHALMAEASQDALQAAQKEGQKVSSEWVATAKETAKSAAAQVEKAQERNPFKAAAQLPDIWKMNTNFWWQADEWLPTGEVAKSKKDGGACPIEGCEASAKPVGDVKVAAGKVTVLN